MLGFRFLAQNNLLWRVLDGSVLRLTRHLQYHRDFVERERFTIAQERKLAQFVKNVSPNLTVLSGLFEGMKYPNIASFGSAIVPKFLGCYEKEIAEHLQRLIETNTYDCVVDIGSAEGYYAVGIAMKLPAVKVFAYDISPVAQTMCKSLAELNGVADRVEVRGLCAPDDLCDLLKCKRALVIMDCEGAEAELLTPKVAKACVGHDLLIELHDTVVLGGVTERIESRFKATHKIATVPATYDCIKARTYQFPSFDGMNFEDRLWAVSEHRQTGIEWCFLLSSEHVAI